jgi:curved DNA-binding protein CbpA
MTYYEELGLGQDATDEQIRQAHRKLARVLHPDRQADESLKRLAEGQMKRLNSIHKTLTDPSMRRQYDAGLNPEVPVPMVLPLSSRAERFPTYRDAALLAAGIIAASVYWQMPPASVPRTSPSAAAILQPPASSAGETRDATSNQSARMAAELARMQRELEAARTERDSALARVMEPQRLTGRLVETFAGSPMPAPPPALSPIQAPVQVPALATPQSSTTTARSQFEGTWVYVRPRVGESQKAQYPAEYVEAVVVEETGVLRGRYRARYLVADRPISSDVRFQFEGKADGEAVSLEWTGAGGSRGELNLKLLSRNLMQLEWIATELGSQLGLASGTAVLTRWKEP